MATDTETTNPYTDNGYRSRADYLAQLCDEYPADVVHTIADLLGETEDFDGLVTMLEDYEIDNAYDAAYTADDDATGFYDALAARNAARATYTAASAALEAARAAYADALKAYTAASATLDASEPFS